MTRKSKNSNNNNKIIVLLLLVGFAILIYPRLGMWVRDKKATSNSPTIPVAEVNPDIQVLESDRKGWKTYVGEVYSISAPSDWTVSLPQRVSSQTGFPQVIRLYSPKKSASLFIGAKWDNPHGYGETYKPTPEKKVTVTVGGKQYNGSETSIDIQPETRVVTLELVDKTWYSPKLDEDLPLMIMYGNDYPVDSNGVDDPDYYLYSLDLPTIYSILQTFRMIDVPSPNE
ncbi:MAG: hypothetical protein HYS86_00160 [Candidatus Chisholmbacteria bacterium]|nr:hypothetical protein [Candidatus Chisholmbacteria bacterium]